jgi:aminoglycoside phosphotransferase (APT) family kinase protein
LVRTWPLKGGISAEMTALEVKDPDGRKQKLIVRRPGVGTFRRNPQAAANEFKLLQITRSFGLATQRAYYLDQSSGIFGAPYLVIGYIEGQPEFAPVDLDDFSRQCAVHLAKIHSVNCATMDLSFLPKQAEELTELIGNEPANLSVSMEEGRIRDTLEAAWPLSQQNAPVLRHGDFWPGNLLWRDKQLVAVIDWEDAQLGDPLTDLAISRLDMLCIFGRGAMDSFTQQYHTRMAIDLTDLPYWDLYAALRFMRLTGADLAEWAAFYPPFGRPDITEETLREHYQYFINQAYAKLALI